MKPVDSVSREAITTTPNLETEEPAPSLSDETIASLDLEPLEPAPDVSHEVVTATPKLEPEEPAPGLSDETIASPGLGAIGTGS